VKTWSHLPEKPPSKNKGTRSARARLPNNKLTCGCGTRRNPYGHERVLKEEVVVAIIVFIVFSITFL